MADKMDRGLDEIIADTVSSYHSIWLLFFYAISRCLHALSSCLDHPKLTCFSASQRSNRPRNNRGQGRRREPRNDFPRDGVRKVGTCAFPVIMRLC